MGDGVESEVRMAWSGVGLEKEGAYPKWLHDPASATQMRKVALKLLKFVHSGAPHACAISHNALILLRTLCLTPRGV
jgi:hypothetical protein